jgi:hypothetical protein
MTVPEALRNVRYVVNSEGERTDAIIPLAAWQTLVASWRQSLQRLEDQEDRAILLQWLEKRAAGGVEMIPLEELEQNLAADGLL